jgi:hypothetical protein
MSSLMFWLLSFWNLEDCWPHVAFSAVFISIQSSIFNKIKKDSQHLNEGDINCFLVYGYYCIWSESFKESSQKSITTFAYCSTYCLFVATVITFLICSRQHSRQYSCHMLQMMRVQYRFHVMII